MSDSPTSDSVPPVIVRFRLVEFKPLDSRSMPPATLRPPDNQDAPTTVNPLPETSSVAPVPIVSAPIVCGAWIPGPK